MNQEKDPAGRCSAYFEKLSERELSAFFQDAGLERMHGKADLLLPSILKNGGDHAFLHLLFLSSGTSGKNKENYAELFERISRYEKEILLRDADAILWGESGLLPADNTEENIHPDAREMVKDLWKRWWSIRKDARETRSVWSRGKARPQSSPERKVAFLIAFIRAYSFQPLRDFLIRSEKTDAKKLSLLAEEFFLCSDPYWDSHTSFRAEKLKRSSAVSGNYRARTFAADALFPVLHALAKIRKDRAGMKRIDQAYLLLPQQLSNAVTRRFFERAFHDPHKADTLLKSAAERQGALHLRKQYCVPAGEDCSKCVLLRSLFPKLSGV